MFIHRLRLVRSSANGMMNVAHACLLWHHECRACFLLCRACITPLGSPISKQQPALLQVADAVNVSLNDRSSRLSLSRQFPRGKAENNRNALLVLQYGFGHGAALSVNSKHVLGMGGGDGHGHDHGHG